MIPREIRTWIIFAALACVLVAILLTMSWCDQRARQGRNIAVATGKALDKVAAETPIIRQDQEEKQREVDQIEGADGRLPDGFGADLERVRRGNHPR